jgi:alpha-L-fucosidase
MKRTPRLIPGLILLSFAMLLGCQTAKPGPVEEWQSRRFGMFIHWGPVAQKGTEIGWSRGRQVSSAEYDELYKTFNPTRFDADAWTGLAKAAGMRYLVITAKHHDGFCLWPSRYTGYTIARTPYKQDILAQLSAACRRNDIQFSTYYSLCDWRHPDYPLDSPGGTKAKPVHNMPQYFEFVKDQTAELVVKYGPLGLMWFDGEWETPWTDDYGKELYAALKVQQPSLLVNNRVGKARRGMSGETKGLAVTPGDFDTPEQQVGKFQRDRPWESCITLCRQWAWKPNDKMKSLQECIRTLLQVIGGDGNLLFNVGPMPDGSIEPRQIARLKEMGAWVQRYSDAIYDTRGGPFKPGTWGSSTCKGRKIYVFVTEWPADGPLVLPEIPAKILSARLLSGGQAIARHEGGRLFIKVGEADRRKIATVVEITLDQRAFDLPPR